jgi:hypothetical protein
MRHKNVDCLAEIVKPFWVLGADDGQGVLGLSRVVHQLERFRNLECPDAPRATRQMFVEKPCLPRRDLVALGPALLGVKRAHVLNEASCCGWWNRTMILRTPIARLVR